MQRSEQELDTLERISQALGAGLELEQAFHSAMATLGQQLQIYRSDLLLWDQTTDKLKTSATINLNNQSANHSDSQTTNKAITKLIATSQTQIIPDIYQPNNGSEAQTNQTLDKDGQPTTPTSYICIPIKAGDRLLGAICIYKPYQNNTSLNTDTRLLTIVTGLISQTIRIHQLIQIEKDQWLQENQQLRDTLLSKYRFDNIIGSSPAMLDVLATIAQVAPTRATCLLLGETGCGKELIAKAIHYNSPRNPKPLIRVNCGALSPQLLESELFGHVQGAFTGALRDKIGRFEAANGGTIFLDEIGTLDPKLQVKLLRVLQEREFERVGDNRTVQSDVRIIAATNLNLEEEVQRGTFREDLYYRLNVVTINLPPLRSRREDIPLLIDHFLDRYNRENQRNLCKINRKLIDTLIRYPWPGNVRELENTIERAVVLSSGEEFTEDALPLHIRLFAQQIRGDHNQESISDLAIRLAAQAVKSCQSNQNMFNTVVSEVERQLIKEALNQNNSVKVRAAEFLGINRNTLNKKVKEYNL